MTKYACIACAIVARFSRGDATRPTGVVKGKKKFAFSREFGRYPLSKYVGALKQLIAEYPTTDNPKINGFRRDERGVLERLVFQLRFPCQMLSIFLLWCGNLIT